MNAQRILLLSFFSILTAISVEAHAGQLACRGGGDMKMTIIPISGGSRFKVEYKKSSESYVNRLEPGECIKWPPQGPAFNEDDPSMFFIDLRHFAIVHINSAQPDKTYVEITGERDRGWSRENTVRFKNTVMFNKNHEYFSVDTRPTLTEGMYNIFRFNPFNR